MELTQNKLHCVCGYCVYSNYLCSTSPCRYLGCVVHVSKSPKLNLVDGAQLGTGSCSRAWQALKRVEGHVEVALVPVVRQLHRVLSRYALKRVHEWKKQGENTLPHTNSHNVRHNDATHTGQAALCVPVLCAQLLSLLHSSMPVSWLCRTCDQKSIVGLGGHAVNRHRQLRQGSADPRPCRTTRWMCAGA
jgi:hypothetical protein